MGCKLVLNYKSIIKSAWVYIIKKQTEKLSSEVNTSGKQPDIDAVYRCQLLKSEIIEKELLNYAYRHNTTQMYPDGINEIAKIILVKHILELPRNLDKPLGCQYKSVDIK